MMRPLEPILIADRFPDLLETLLDLLGNLPGTAWDAPTACAGWTVKDVALHLLGDDVGMLSRGRDAYAMPGASIATWDELVAFINQQNALWVQATRRMSPRLLCDLLKITGEQVSKYFQSLDPFALGGAVSWAGPEPAPVWLDLAREYTERWHHQQHIRDATGRPGLTEPRYFAPVLDAFVRALPHTYRAIEAAEQTAVALTITGASGGMWCLLREPEGWKLYREHPSAPHAGVVLDQDTAWRLFTKGVGKETARARATLTGDQRLGEHVLEAVALIA